MLISHCSSRRPLHWWLAMDSNHPRRLYESRVLPRNEPFFLRNLAGRAGFEPAHGVINSHVPFQLGYRPKTSINAKRPRLFCRSLREFGSELRVLRTDKSRRPSAIDAQSHHGFVPYHHCEIEYSTISLRETPTYQEPKYAMRMTASLATNELK